MHKLSNCGGRYGLGEGFSNLTKKKVHDAATKFQKSTTLSFHENWKKVP